LDSTDSDAVAEVPAVALELTAWSLSNLTALLRQQLFVYRDLYAWLDNPFQPPPALEGWHDGQLALEF